MYDIDYYEGDVRNVISIEPDDIVSMDLKKGEYNYEFTEEEDTVKIKVSSKRKKTLNISKFFNISLT